MFDFYILIKKQPSPLANPANQLGSLIYLFVTNGLSIGLISTKAYFNLFDKPKFKDYFIATIFFNL